MPLHKMGSPNVIEGKKDRDMTAFSGRYFPRDGTRKPPPPLNGGHTDLQIEFLPLYRQGGDVNHRMQPYGNK